MKTLVLDFTNQEDFLNETVLAERGVGGGVIERSQLIQVMIVLFKIMELEKNAFVNL